MERFKFVIKLKNSNKYLLPTDYNNRWVDIENALFFDYDEKIKKANQLVDNVWIMDDEVELKKIKLKIEIEFIEEEIKEKNFLFSKLDKERILKKRKIKYYNSFGTIIKKENLMHSIIENIVRDKHYLYNVKFKKKRKYDTVEKIMKSVKKIKDYENHYIEIHQIFPFITLNDLEKIKNKLQ